MINDIMQYIAFHKIPGLLVQKTFDSVFWSFIDKALDKFNFKTSVKSWIEIFYKKSMFRVMINVFQLLLNCTEDARNETPSHLIYFIIYAEIIRILVRSNKNIKVLTLMVHNI